MLKGFSEAIKKNPYTSTALSIIFLLALWVRIANLHLYYFNPDEAFNLTMYTHSSITRMLADNNNRNSHPPLSNLLGMPIAWLAKATGNDLLFRLAGLLPGLALVMLSFRLGLRLGGLRYAVVPSAIIAFGFASISMSAEVRSYSLQVAFQTGSLLFLLEYLDNGKARSILWYYAMMLMAVLTDYPSLLALTGTGLAVTIIIMQRNKWRLGTSSTPQLAAWLVPNFLIGLAAISLISIQHAFVMGNMRYAENSYPYDLQRYVHTIFMMYDYFISGQSLYPLTAGVLLLSLIGIVKMLIDRRMEMLLIALGPVLINAVTNSLHIYPFSSGRHNYYLLPYLMLLPAYGFAFLWERIWPVLRVRNNYLAPALAVLSAGIMSLHIVHNDYYKKPFTEFPFAEKKYLGGSEEIMSRFYPMVGQNDIIISHGWMANYLIHKTGIDAIRKLPYNVQTINYQGRDILIYDYITNKYPENPSSYAELMELMKAAKTLRKGRQIEKVWLLNPGATWYSQLTLLVRNTGVFKELRPYIKEAFDSPIITYCYIDWDKLEELVGNKID